MVKKLTLFEEFPELVKEWDYDKNGNLKPDNVTAHSGKKVWWKCKHGHTWETSVSNRSRGTNCPKCFELKRNGIIKMRLGDYYEK